MKVSRTEKVGNVEVTTSIEFDYLTDAVRDTMIDLGFKNKENYCTKDALIELIREAIGNEKLTKAEVKERLRGKVKSKDVDDVLRDRTNTAFRWSKIEDQWYVSNEDYVEFI